MEYPGSLLEAHLRAPWPARYCEITTGQVGRLRALPPPEVHHGPECHGGTRRTIRSRLLREGSVKVPSPAPLSHLPALVPGFRPRQGDALPDNTSQPDAPSHSEKLAGPLLPGQAEFLHAIEQGVARDVQEPRSLSLVVAASLQRLLDQSLLDLFERDALIRDHHGKTCELRLP